MERLGIAPEKGLFLCPKIREENEMKWREIIK